jgi:enoyl-CoA hydratase
VGDLAAAREWIDPCYGGNDAVTILAALQAHPAPGAQYAADVMATRSPFAVSIALQAIRRARRMETLSQVLAQDLMLGGAMADSLDFVEGVRALLVDRDNAPRWAHRSLADVDPGEIAGAFAGDLFTGARLKAMASPDEGQRLPRLEPAENAAAPPREEDVE